jgi:hypothetical protein
MTTLKNVFAWIVALVAILVAAAGLWVLILFIAWLFWLPLIYFLSWISHNAFATVQLTWAQCRAVALIVAVILSTLHSANSGSKKDS